MSVTCLTTVFVLVYLHLYVYFRLAYLFVHLMLPRGAVYRRWCYDYRATFTAPMPPLTCCVSSSLSRCHFPQAHHLLHKRSSLVELVPGLNASSSIASTSVYQMYRFLWRLYLSHERPPDLNRRCVSLLPKLLLHLRRVPNSLRIFTVQKMESCRR